MITFWSMSLFATLFFSPLPDQKKPAREEYPPHCVTEIFANAIYPAGLPILISVKVSNTGKEPFRYPFLLGSGRYPNARLFKTKVIDDKGEALETELSNDLSDSPGGSGGVEQIPPGGSVIMPAAFHPFPPGLYKIKIGEGKITQLTVKDDNEVAQKWIEDMLSKIRRGDSFALHVAGRYPTDALIEALLKELCSDDFQVAYRASLPLGRLKKLPANSLEYIKKGMKKHLELLNEGRASHTGVLSSLAHLASEIGSDQALEPVLTLARSAKGKGAAIVALGDFKQEKAAKELQHFLNDENEENQFRAAQALAKRKDKGALEVLLVVANDPKSGWRQFAVQELPKFPDDPRVEAAIKSRLQDPDMQVRQFAELALRDLARAKKLKDSE